MKTQQQRQEEKKREKLELMEEQIKAGTLVVRKMTDAEKASFPEPKTTGRRRRRR